VKIPASVLVQEDDTTLSMLHMFTTPISSFSSVEGIVELLPPLFQSVFPFETVQQLESIYQELYPSDTITYVPHFIAAAIV